MNNNHLPYEYKNVCEWINSPYTKQQLTSEISVSIDLEKLSIHNTEEAIEQLIETNSCYMGKDNALLMLPLKDIYKRGIIVKKVLLENINKSKDRYGKFAFSSKETHLTSISFSEQFGIYDVETDFLDPTIFLARILISFDPDLEDSYNNHYLQVSLK